MIDRRKIFWRPVLEGSVWGSGVAWPHTHGQNLDHGRQKVEKGVIGRGLLAIQLHGCAFDPLPGSTSAFSPTFHNSQKCYHIVTPSRSYPLATSNTLWKHHQGFTNAKAFLGPIKLITKITRTLISKLTQYSALHQRGSQPAEHIQGIHLVLDS